MSAVERAVKPRNMNFAKVEKRGGGGGGGKSEKKKKKV